MAIATLSEMEKFDVRSPSAFRIYHFFEKWAVLSQEGQLDHRLMNAALGGRATWWNESFFAPIRSHEDDIYMKQTLDLIHTQVFSRIQPLAPR